MLFLTHVPAPYKPPRRAVRRLDRGADIRTAARCLPVRGRCRQCCRPATRPDRPAPVPTAMLEIIVIAILLGIFFYAVYRIAVRGRKPPHRPD